MILFGDVRLVWLFALAIGPSLGGCGSSKVLVPPRMDLARYETIGMIEFSSSGVQNLAGTASREFLAAIHSAQPGTPVLELGNEAQVLSVIHAQSLDPAAIRSIGEKFHVDALVVGMLGAQEVKPRLSVGPSLESLSASAELEGVLDARILETRSGATIWTAAARAKEPLARVNLSGEGLSGVGASLPGDAKTKLVQCLVQRATEDFWSRWERQ